MGSDRSSASSTPNWPEDPTEAAEELARSCHSLLHIAADENRSDEEFKTTLEFIAEELEATADLIGRIIPELQLIGESVPEFAGKTGQTQHEAVLKFAVDMTREWLGTVAQLRAGLACRK